MVNHTPQEIITILREKGYSYQEIADLSGTAKGIIHRVDNGKNFTMITYHRICNIPAGLLHKRSKKK